MEQARREDQVYAVAALQHPLSRQAYELVVDRGTVSRDDAAAELGVGRSVAAFHLDKLIAAGLLEARFQRLSGRTGPGAGRPAKLYRRSGRDVAVSLPPRRYDLAGDLLAESLGRVSAGQTNVEAALAETARETGRRMGARAAEQRSRSGHRPRLLRALADNGYQPREEGRSIVLANCPFHSLVERHPELVCRMNLNLLGGMVEGLGCDDRICAHLEPAPGRCCVRLGSAGSRAGVSVPEERQ